MRDLRCSNTHQYKEYDIVENYIDFWKCESYNYFLKFVSTCWGIFPKFSVACCNENRFNPPENCYNRKEELEQ